MPDDIDLLAKRVNEAYLNEPGFLDCHVESRSGRVLAYRFADSGYAHRFQRTRLLHGIKATIPFDRRATVLVNHD